MQRYPILLDEEPELIKEREEKNRLKSELEKLKKEYEYSKDLANRSWKALTDRDREVEVLRDKLKQELKKLKDDEIERLRLKEKELRDQIEELRRSHQEELNVLRRSHQEEIGELKERLNKKDNKAQEDPPAWLNPPNVAYDSARVQEDSPALLQFPPNFDPITSHHHHRLNEIDNRLKEIANESPLLKFKNTLEELNLEREKQEIQHIIEMLKKKR